MKIHRITAAFGEKQRDSLLLGSGLNIIQYPEKTGSVPWPSFFLDLFFGGDRRNYPGAVPLYGSLDCLCGDEDEKLSLVRKTERPTAPLAEFAAIYPDTWEPVDALNSQNCGPALLGASRKTLVNSVLIGSRPAEGLCEIHLPPRLEQDNAMLQNQLQETQEEIQRLKNQEEELESQMIASLAPQDAAKRQPELQSARENAQQAERKAANMAGQLAAAMVPGNAAIARIRKAIVNLMSIRGQWETARERYEKTSNALQQSAMNLQNNPFAGQTAAEARRTAASPATGAVDLRMPPFCIWILVLGLALSAFVCVKLWSKKPLAILSAAALVIVTLITVGVLRQKTIQKRRKELLLRRFGSDQPNELTAMAEEYGKMLASNSELQKSVKTAAAETDSLSHTYSELETAILTEVRHFAPDTKDIAAADELLRQSAAARKQLSLAEQEARAARLQYEQLLMQIPREQPENKPEEEPQPDPEQEKIAQELEELRQALDTAKRQAEQLAEQLSAARATEESERRIAEQLLQMLPPASVDENHTVHPAILQRTMEIFHEFPSNPDSLYLAARLALSELTVPPDRNVPLFLDNALSLFSDEDCTAVLAWLRNAAEKRQILLFTRTPREAAFFHDDPDVTCQTLELSPHWDGKISEIWPSI